MGATCKNVNKLTISIKDEELCIGNGGRFLNKTVRALEGLPVLFYKKEEGLQR